MKPLLIVTLALCAGIIHATAQTQTAPAQQAPTAPAAPTAAAAPAGNAETGKKLYDSYGCYQCHGFEGQGSSATGPRLGPRPLPLVAFRSYVRRPSGVMPPYSTKLVSDADLAHIHAYLASRPAPSENIPLLQK